jgi:hypothetical protein
LVHSTLFIFEAHTLEDLEAKAKSAASAGWMDYRFS